jgi:hypothetical protein
MKKIVLCIPLLCCVLAACELSFGKLGGADEYRTYRPANPENSEDGDPEFASILDRMCGEWYSHYGADRLDGYRIGKFGVDGENFEQEMGRAKLALFPTNDDPFEPPYPLYQGGEPEAYTPRANDYYLVYDDTVYGQNDQGEGCNGGWEDLGLIMRYAGIVRAVNVFNNDENTGAVIVQYFAGCPPTWTAEVKAGELPFFGMYYRVHNENLVQMANAVELAGLFSGEAYHTETATLGEAIEKNNAVNDSEFISWDIVWPQDRKR